MSVIKPRSGKKRRGRGRGGVRLAEEGFAKSNPLIEARSVRLN